MGQLFADLPAMTAPPRPAPLPRPSRAKPKRPVAETFGLIVTDPHAYRLEAQRKMRRCLSCNDNFASTGPGNRICGSCKSLDAWTSPAEFTVAAAF
jgi:hypothetical protein